MYYFPNKIVFLSEKTVFVLPSSIHVEPDDMPYYGPLSGSSQFAKVRL